MGFNSVFKGLNSLEEEFGQLKSNSLVSSIVYVYEQKTIEEDN